MVIISAVSDFIGSSAKASYHRLDGLTAETVSGRDGKTGREGDTQSKVSRDVAYYVCTEVRS
jgi:hypothetical protein